VAAIVALSLVPGDWRPSIGLAKGYEHFLAYFVVAAVLTTALRAGWPHIAALVVLAGMLEAAQGWIPGRDPNLVDFLGSSTGALLGFATRSIIMPRRRERFAAEAAGESANRAVPRCADVGVVIAVGAALTWISVSLAHDTAGLLGAALALVMLAIAVIDARYFLIPDPLNAAGFALGVAHSAVFAPDGDIVAAMAGAALRAAVLALVFLGLRFIYARVRGRQGIGLGDVKLAAVAGAWLDWQFMPIAVEIAALSALAVYVLRRHALRQPLRSDSRLPFGMYFAPAIWIGWLLQTALTRGW
jgi:leader peptidase (prepilin peptidase)/N-methyltransferase